MTVPAVKTTRFTARKCDATGRLIGSKDHAAVQINFAEVDGAGVVTGTYKSFALSGFVRHNNEADDSINRLATEAGFLKSVWSAQQ